jgi:hypothetical protein
MNRCSYLKTVLDMPETQDLLAMYQMGGFEQVAKQKLC